MEEWELVLVEWEDPWSHSGWIELEEALRLATTPGRGECKTLGWIIDQDDEYILLASSIGITKDAQVGDIFRLPRRVIDNITPLTKARVARKKAVPISFPPTEKVEDE